VITQEQANDYIMFNLLKIAHDAGLESISMSCKDKKIVYVVGGSPWAIKLFTTNVLAFTPDFFTVMVMS